MDSSPTLTHDRDQHQVTAVISHRVKPDQQQAYEQWLHGISAVAQQFEGHMGVNFIRPQDPHRPDYVIILKFDCYRNLKTWMDSSVRQDWIDQVQPLVQQEQDVQILTGLETWFTLPGRMVQTPPARYKMALLTSLSVFIMAQSLRIVLAPLLSSLPVLLGSFLLTVLTVFLLTYIVMPRVTRAAYRWLYPNPAKPTN